MAKAQTPSNASLPDAHAEGRAWAWAGGFSVLLLVIGLLFWFLVGPGAGEANLPPLAIQPVQATPTPASLSGRITPPADPAQVVMPEVPAQRNGMFAAPPPFIIDPTKTYYATFVTAKGQFTAKLEAALAPNTVNNFVYLARAHFYDNTTFHRVISDFMAQGGDPTGTGSGGPGYNFADELTPQLRHDRIGTLSMANAGPNTNGSQFFITFGPTPWLDGYDENGNLKPCGQAGISCHTVFGYVVDGLDVLQQITPRQPGDAIPGDTLYTIVITEQ